MLTDDQAIRAERILRRMVRASWAVRERNRDDVVQEAMLRLCKCGKISDRALKEKCKWAINAPAIKSLRCERAREVLARLDVMRLRSLGRLVFAGERDEERALAAAELSDLLAEIDLNPRDKRIVQGVLSGLTHAAIASSLGVSRPAVTRRISRVRQRIADLMDSGYYTT